MNTFLQTYRLALTPLSPIHIGCGADFEPTNYVIDGDLLYGFDPSRALLNDLQKSELASAVASHSLLSIQRFFKKHSRSFQAQAEVIIPVAAGVAQQYTQRVGQVANREGDGRQVFNQLALERTIWAGALQQPYIPGSSFKGAIRTAWLDELNAERRPIPDDDVRRGTTRLEARLLQGDFKTSPLRLLKIADLMPASGTDPARRVLYSVNLKKKKVTDAKGQELKGKGPSARKECIQHGQHRAFVADAVVPSLDPHTNPKSTPAPALRLSDLGQIARQSNAYHLQRLRRELSVLAGRGFVDPNWKRSIDALLADALSQRLQAGEAFLIRLGRYGGADNKTLTGEGVASIKIMGAKGQPPTFESTTKTVWLAAEHEGDHSGLLPFGWAVVEIDPKEGDLPELKAWCAAQSQGRPDMAALRRQFEADKQAALQQKAEQAAIAVKALEAKKAEELAARLRAEALASMTVQAQQIEALRQKCDEWAAKMPPNGNFKHQKLNEKLFQDAIKLTTQALADAGWQAADKTALADMLEQCLPKVVAPWGKDEKKKLKISALRSH